MSSKGRGRIWIWSLIGKSHRISKVPTTTAASPEANEPQIVKPRRRSHLPPLRFAD